jgi:hypothetical protein
MRTQRAWPVVLTAGALLIVGLSCDHSETVAPDGSTITLTANPAQIVLVGGIQPDTAPVSILATVRDAIGVPLPGQDVRFTTTSGDLTPPGGNPVTTDKIGNAVTILNNVLVGPQLTATSGKATASLTLTASTGLIAQITLSSDSTAISSCNDTFEVTATALDPSGDPVGGVTIFFEIVHTSTVFNGPFSPSSSGQTDATTGEVKRTLSLDATSCEQNCQTPGKDCQGDIRATDQSKAIISNLVHIIDQIQP